VARAFFRNFDGPKWEVEVDVTYRENHGSRATVTKHAIETGANSADHIRPEPLTLSLEVGVTDNPIAVPTTQNDGIERVTKPLFTFQKTKLDRDGVARAGQIVTVSGNVLSGKLQRVQKVYEEFLQRQRKGLLANVETSLLTYQAMAFTDIRAPIETVGRCVFTLELEQVQFDTLALVDAIKLPPKPKKANGKPKTEMGKKPGADVDAGASENQDLLTGIGNMFSEEPESMSSAEP